MSEIFEQLLRYQTKKNQNMIHGGDIYRNKVDMDFSVNLNPNALPESVFTAIEDGIRRCGNYPDICQSEVRDALANLENIGSECIYCGNGASELIVAVVRDVAPKKALIIEPSFGGYRHAINSIGDCSVDELILGRDSLYRPGISIIDRIDKDTDIIFLTDPWNPTGYCMDRNLLIGILDRADECDTAVLLDQSFYMLSDNVDIDMSMLTQKYKRLYIIRSFTKLLGLPGIRMGYVISHENNIEHLAEKLPEWNISCIAESVISRAAQVLKNDTFIEDSMKIISAEREYLCAALKKLGLTVYESNTTYILFEAVHDLYDALLKRKILIRDCSDYIGLKKGFFRIAVKDHESNERLIRSITEVLYGN